MKEISKLKNYSHFYNVFIQSLNHFTYEVMDMATPYGL